ncbi:hypothetical protein UFOVP1095_33 [uncultured Caudovirales phage]|uniref:Uncharacterized protein n=1 Tax=uncultured Caudovirales phage TaxID=2100421 RepID=A0A6J5SK39_9CAUD|nr:hypothetical protein UFOVP918_33 [uncultured Caudovirales phage]CAB4182666.1 hypothetical protein UFOVP1095_33 [uncultured Caudovirales phage]CAB4214218.1 hypothetical protein UFOVP1452_33 [uncultured Caudovirales phage]CAB5228303.1 hypothetical protein UFOVP1540_10 [uncultured Caudovirales phage]
MAYNGSGTFNLYTPGNPTITGTTISSSWANNTLSDLATGLTTAVTKDGQTVTTGSIPFAAGISVGGAFVVDSSGNLAVTTNKFTVAASSGNTAVAGTLAVTGHTTFEGVTSTGATGTGKLVYDTSPVLVTPNLGTPSALVGTNITGTGASFTAGAVAVGGITGLGTGVATALAVNVGSAGAPVVNGGALGTPASGNLSNCTNAVPDVYTGTSAANLTFPVGSCVAVSCGATAVARNAVKALYLSATDEFSLTVSGTALTGTWNARGVSGNDGGGGNWFLFQRTA